MPDPLSHLLIGYAVGKFLGLRGNKLWLFVIASLLPDVDIVAGMVYAYEMGMDPIRNMFMFHPTLPASVFFYPILSLLYALLLRPFGWKVKEGFSIIFSSQTLHLILDLLQTGNRPFWPIPFECGLGLLPYTIEGRVATLLISAGLAVIARLMPSHQDEGL